MKWLKKIKGSSITFLIYSILFFIITNGALDYYYRKVFESHEAIVKEVEDAKRSMTTILDALKNIDLGFRGYYIIQKPHLLVPYHGAMESIPREFKNLEATITKQGLTANDLRPVKNAFEKYMELMEEMIRWRDQDRTAEIDSVIDLDPGYDLWLTYDTYDKIFQKEQAAILAHSEHKAQIAVFVSTIVRLSLLLFGIPTLLVVAFRLNREKKRRRDLFADLDLNNRKFLFDPNDKENTIEEQTIINTLIANLQKASEFISSIAKGNYETKWEGLTENNKKANEENLVGELLKMRDQMIKVKQEDNIRMWVTEGISKFSELVRQHQGEMEELSDKLTSNVAKYLKANQVFLYFVSEKDSQTVLELFGCYAYDRKKYMEKIIEPGQGLIGQTYLEKSVNHLINIPQDYVQITSGLGEATPRSLLIVPLKFNDEVEGILEIASFNAFQQHEIDFLERIGEIIASAIVNIQGSVKMKKLMQTMQIQSEEMKAQEEEMRQNMEELQATQEEMSRKAKEYQAVIVEKETIIEQKTQEITSMKQQLSS